MNILIVDDEISSIEAVKRSINWDKLTVTSIYTATSMREAIEQLNRNDINIMLSDIEMPMGTGIDLLRWVKDNKAEVECIFMTCHADFKYAQKAIQLGSMDYLLKPLRYEEVEKAISKAIEKVTDEKAIKKNSDAWLENKEIILKQFWKDFFVGDIYPDKNSLLRYIKTKDIDIDIEKNYIPVLVSIKKISEDLTNDEQRLMEFSIRNMSEELFVVEDIHKEVIAFNESSILIMFELDKKLENKNFIDQIKSCCQDLIKTSKQYFRMILCCYIGNSERIYSIPNQIERLQVIDFQNVVYHQDIYVLETYKHYRIEYSNSIFTVWSELVRNNKFHKLYGEIKRMLTAEENLKRIDRQFLLNFYQDYYYILIVFSTKNNIFLSELFGDEKSQKIFQNAFTSLDNLLHMVNYTLDTMKEHVNRNEKEVSPVHKTKKYIENHISEEISMEDLAKNVHLNADYLTRIFKKEVGISISKYIINRKMEIAKKLLTETNMAIGEIALEVGYFNYSSFNRIFSKTVEMSPQEYKSLFKS